MATNYRLQTIGRLQTRIGQVYRSRGKERVGSARLGVRPILFYFFLGTFRTGPSLFFLFLLSTVRYLMDIYLGNFPDFPVSSDESNECAYLTCTCIHDSTTWTLTWREQGRTGQGRACSASVTGSNPTRDERQRHTDNTDKRICSAQPSLTQL